MTWCRWFSCCSSKKEKKAMTSVVIEVKQVAGQNHTLQGNPGHYLVEVSKAQRDPDSRGHERTESSLGLS